MSDYSPAERWTPGTRPRPRPPESWTPGTPPGARLRQAWRVGQCGYVRITGADVVRISDALADTVRAVLEDRGVPLGPVLATRPRGVVEILVPVGTSATWPPLPYTRCVPEAELRCPAPSVTETRSRHPGGRYWINPPSAPHDALTDADALGEAITTALARRRRASADLTSSGPGRARMHPSAPRGRALEQELSTSHALSTLRRLHGRSENTPSKARAFVDLTLAEWGVAETVRADMKLIVSELATNAVTHALSPETPSPEITVEVTLTDDEAAVSVGDSGPHRQLHAQQAAPDDEHGRGLLLVEALASRWGQSRGDCGGTIVHAEIDLPTHQPLSTGHTIKEATDAARHHP